MTRKGVTQKGNKTCIHYERCRKAGILTCTRGDCRDYTGTIILKGLLYRCTCGYTDAIRETDDGRLVCDNCGAITNTPLYNFKED